MTTQADLERATELINKVRSEISGSWVALFDGPMLEDAIAQALAAERERCAKVAERYAVNNFCGYNCSEGIASAIREGK